MQFHRANVGQKPFEVQLRRTFHLLPNVLGFLVAQGRAPPPCRSWFGPARTGHQEVFTLGESNAYGVSPTSAQDTVIRRPETAIRADCLLLRFRQTSGNGQSSLVAPLSCRGRYVVASCRRGLAALSTPTNSAITRNSASSSATKRRVENSLLSGINSIDSCVHPSTVLVLELR